MLVTLITNKLERHSKCLSFIQIGNDAAFYPLISIAYIFLQD